MGLIDDIDWNIAVGFVPTLLSFFAYIVPLFLTLVYFIFGSEFILFVWIDNVLVFLITHWVSNVTPLVHIFSLLIYFYYIAFIYEEDAQTKGLLAFFYISIVFEVLIGYKYTQQTMESSGDACRHLNPQWDFISRGAKLYPTILYLFGIKDRKKGG